MTDLNWRLNLIRRRARRLGLRDHDLEDACQELALDVLGFVYDAERANGASLSTALISFIDGRLRNLQRATQRHRRRHEFLEDRVAAGHEPIVHAEERTDLDATINQLTDQERRLCQALVDGQRVSELAKDWGCCRDTLVRRLKHIRQQVRATLCQ